MAKTDKSSSLKTVPFSKIILVLFILFFGFIGTYFLFISSAVPSPPTVYITPPSSFMPTNTNFSVQVRENSGTTNVNAVQANISYPTSLLTLVSVDLTGTAFSTTAQNTSGNGSINLGLGTCGGCAAPTGDQLVATLNFKTNTTGGAAVVAFTTGTMLVSSTTNQDILPGGLAATAGFTVNVDTTAPAVSISSPTNNSTVPAGSNVNVVITATDADRVSSVDLYLDCSPTPTCISGTKLTTLTTSPYNYTWNTASIALGNHSLFAKATDPSGNTGNSSVVTVTIADQTAPTESISSVTPTNVVSSVTYAKGTVSVNATANDETGGSGVAKVELLVDGVSKITDTTAPYSFTWDTSTVTNASHNLTVKATDVAGNTATSTPATAVTVDNQAPTPALTFQMTANTLTSITVGWTAGTDNNAVTGYKITRTLNGVTTTVTTTSGSTLSYTDTGLTGATTYTYNIYALDAAGNQSTPATLTTQTITIPGDANGDGHVTITDLSILLSNYGSTTNLSADFNHDGVVSIIDLSILLSHYGT